MKAVLFVICSLFLVSPVMAASVTLYSDRPTARLMPFIQEFEAATGHQVQVIEAGAPELIKRLVAEGAQASADLLWVKDLVYLHDASAAGLFQPMKDDSAFLEVDASMRDLSAGWTAVTYRARTMIYNPQFVKASELSSYENLATDEWRGSLCVRVSSSSYNEGLASFLVENHGEPGARRILSGWMANLARPPFANDNAVIEAVARGECLVGIVNTYYVGQQKSQSPQIQVEVFFADQDRGGVHTNGTGIGLLKTSTQPEVAQAFVAHLMSPSVQQRLADAGFEYPARRTVLPTSVIRQFGSFVNSALSWTGLGLRIESARQVMADVGY